MRAKQRLDGSFFATKADAHEGARSTGASECPIGKGQKALMTGGGVNPAGEGQKALGAGGGERLPGEGQKTFAAGGDGGGAFRAWSDLPQSALVLSIRQPWITLILAGLKTVEVRRWATAVRGPILLHAGRQADPRPEGWALVPPEYLPLTDRCGGLIGAAEVADCIAYGSPKQFALDGPRHRNPEAWYHETGLCGFVLRDIATVPFLPLKGKLFFFPITVSEVGGQVRAMHREKNAAEKSAKPRRGRWC